MTVKVYIMTKGALWDWHRRNYSDANPGLEMIRENLRKYAEPKVAFIGRFAKYDLTEEDWILFNMRSPAQADFIKSDSKLFAYVNG